MTESNVIPFPQSDFQSWLMGVESALADRGFVLLAERHNWRSSFLRGLTPEAAAAVAIREFEAA